MTIRKPNFVLVDECPDWCTIDHKRTNAEPGDHMGELVPETWIADDAGVEVALTVSDGADVAVTIWMGGNEAAVLPVDHAGDALCMLAEVFLTAAYRLDVVEAAEQSTASDKTSYRIDFGPELLPLTPETLLRIKTAENAPDVAEALETGDPQRAAEALLSQLDGEDRA